MSTANSLIDHIQAARGWLVMLALLLVNTVLSDFSYAQTMQRPALQSTLLTKYPLVGIAGHAQHAVAVGWRGAIVTSDDSGQSWQQAPSPVNRDLVAVAMPDAQHVWAVGHGGVVLHSNDAGRTWNIQLDGPSAAALTQSYYQALAKKDAHFASVLASEQSLTVEGEAQPFLDVYFKDANSGYIVGTFNRIYHTQDAGKTWVPLMDKVDNDSELHFYGVAGLGNEVYLTGEQGRVWRLDTATERFEELITPYTGTLFGVLVTEHYLYTYGMRGSLYRSDDRGQTWQTLSFPGHTGISSVIQTTDGALLVIDQGGSVMRSVDDGAHFSPRTVDKPMAFFDALLMPSGTTVLVGAQGLSLEKL